MSDHATVLAALVAKIESVPDRGPVHNRIRYAKNNGALAALFKNATSNRLNGWTVYREYMRQVEYDTGLTRRLDAWRVLGFMAIDDADDSANVLQTQLESIRAVFLADRTLGGVVIDVADMLEPNARIGLQIERIEPWMFAGVLTLRAQCLLQTETEETIS